MPVPALLKLRNYTDKELTAIFLAAIIFICFAGSIGLWIYGMTHASDSTDAKNYRTAISILLFVIGVVLAAVTGYILK
jgi:heme A synthase